MESRHWQDWANLILGGWIFASPWALGYDGVAGLNAHCVGLGVVVFALTAAYVPKAWEELINILFGVWLVVSPFVLGFSTMKRLSLHTVVVGILATAFAIWAMSNDRKFYERWRRGHIV